MNTIIEMLYYCVPAVIVGLVSYYFFYMFVKNENNRRKYYIHKENQKMTLPIRMQAYERLTLFLDRISPNKLLVRIRPMSESKEDYVFQLVKQIEDEFDHNVTQQLYVSQECWNMVKTAKVATVQLINKMSFLEGVETVEDFRNIVFKEFTEKETPSDYATLYVVNEMKDIIG